MYKEETDTFFNVEVFNNDVINVADDNPMIASVNMRLDSDSISHMRKVFRFMEWLGSIGGIEKLLLKWVVFILGGYAQFHSAIEVINM